MGSLYLIDGHNNTLGASKINDTLSVSPGPSYTESRSTRGSFVVNLPFDVPLDGVPTDLDDLVTKKYAGILSLYPGFENILFDEQIDATGWSFPPLAGTPICTVGERQTTSVSIGGTLESIISSLVTAPSTCVIRWEAYKYIYADIPTATVDRSYSEQDPALFTVNVSFDNGVTFNPVSNGLLFNVPLASQGTQFKIRFQRSTGPQKLGLGGWALIY